MRRGTGALVGVGHRAAALQPPFAGGDGAIHAARARRRGGDHTWPGGIEASRDLHQHGYVLLPRAVVRIRQVFHPGDLAFRAGDIALRVHVGAVQRAIAASRGGIDDGAVVGVDRVAPQFRRGRGGGIGRHRRGGAGEPVLAQPRGQQVVAAAVVAVDGNRADIGRLGVGVVSVAIVVIA
ncbi:hypothetical protein D3C72_1641320 [compost metagenome]